VLPGECRALDCQVCYNVSHPGGNYVRACRRIRLAVHTSTLDFLQLAHVGAPRSSSSRLRCRSRTRGARIGLRMSSRTRSAGVSFRFAPRAPPQFHYRPRENA
jgi:hypothetical protein